MPGLQLEHLHKDFSGPAGAAVTALRDFCATIEPGELVAVVGPSGSGKTTLLRLIAGLESPSQGRVFWQGKDITRLPPEQRDLAMVFQHHALLPHLTVAGNIGLGLELRRVPRAQILQTVQSIAERLGIADCLERLPQELSGGQRQRVALGRALARKPALFLFDEPLASLDEPLRVLLRQEIRQLHQESGATSIYVTHDQREAMALGHRVAMLQAGALQQLDRPQQLYQKPANRDVAAFFGSPAMNFFAGSLEAASGQLVFAGGDFRLPLPAALAARLGSFTGKRVEMGLRPEHLRPAVAGSETAIKARLLAVEPQGSHDLWQLKHGQQIITITVPSGFTNTLPEGESEVALNLAHSHWFDAQSGENLLA